MSSLIQKIQKLGFELPEVPTPVASYVPAVKVGNLVYTSGMLPIKDGSVLYKGKADSIDDGYKASQLCVLNALSVLNNVCGLENINQIIKLTGFVNSSEAFTDQPKVINGASDLLVEILGDKGKHARAAVGVAQLPLNATVELDLIVQVKD